MPAITGIDINAVMLDGLTKRDLISIIGGVIVLVVAGSFGGVYLAKHLMVDRSNDPIARAGGLKAEQIIQPK